MVLHVHGYQSRGCTYNVTLFDVNGDPISPDTNDIVHCKILQLGETVTFEVDSTAPTANGSTFTKGDPVNVLRLDAQDLVFDPGVYTISIELTDFEDVNDLKNAQRGVFTLEES